MPNIVNNFEIYKRKLNVVLLKHIPTVIIIGTVFGYLVVVVVVCKGGTGGGGGLLYRDETVKLIKYIPRITYS